MFFFPRGVLLNELKPETSIAEFAAGDSETVFLSYLFKDMSTYGLPLNCLILVPMSFYRLFISFLESVPRMFENRF